MPPGRDALTRDVVPSTALIKEGGTSAYGVGCVAGRAGSVGGVGAGDDAR